MSDVVKIVIEVIVTLLVVAALYIFILPDSKRPALNKFFKAVHDFLKIKKLMVESILRFFYVLSVAFVVVNGGFLLFDEFWDGLLSIVLGPIACRIAYEFLLMTVLMVKNVMEINNHLKGIGEEPEKEKADIQVDELFAKVGKTIQSAATAATTTVAAAAANAKKAGEDETYCHKCGKPIPKTSDFCSFCGTKVETVIEENTDNTNEEEN